MSVHFVSLDSIGDKNSCSICLEDDLPLLGHLAGQPPQMNHLLCRGCLAQRIALKADCPTCSLNITSINGRPLGSHFSPDQAKRFNRHSKFASSLVNILLHRGYPLQGLIKIDLPHKQRPNNNELLNDLLHLDGAPDHWALNEPNVCAGAICTFEDKRGRLGLVVRIADKSNPLNVYLITVHEREPCRAYVIGRPQVLSQTARDLLDPLLEWQSLLTTLPTLLDGTHPTLRLDGILPERQPVPRRGLCTRLFSYFS